MQLNSELFNRRRAALLLAAAPFLFILTALAIVQMPRPAAAVMVWVLCPVSLTHQNTFHIQRRLADENPLQKLFVPHYAADALTPDASVKSSLPPEAKWVALPLPNGDSIAALYLMPNAVLDDFFAHEGIEVYNIL